MAFQAIYIWQDEQGRNGGFAGPARRSYGEAKKDFSWLPSYALSRHKRATTNAVLTQVVEEQGLKIFSEKGTPKQNHWGRWEYSKVARKIIRTFERIHALNQLARLVSENDDLVPERRPSYDTAF